jgi:hypothetical protein
MKEAIKFDNSWMAKEELDFDLANKLVKQA